MKFEDVKIGVMYRVEFDDNVTYAKVECGSAITGFNLKGLTGYFAASQLTPIEPEKEREE